MIFETKKNKSLITNASLKKKLVGKSTGYDNKAKERRNLSMVTMTKKDLVQGISQKLKMHPNDVQNVIQAFLDSMTDTLAQGNRLEFRDFGVFEIVERKQKVGRNPKQANVAIIIPARKAVKFTAGKKMKMLIEAKKVEPSSTLNI
jgi:integration host factor subunit beta